MEADNHDKKWAGNRRILTSGVFLIAGLTIGYFLSQQIDTARKLNVDYAESKFLSEGQIEYACDAIADATLFEYPIYKRVQTSSGGGTDKIALSINRKERYISFLTRASMETGVTEGASFAITGETDTHIMAALPSTFGLGVDTIVFDKKNANAVWTKTRGDALGLSGQSYFLECK